MIALFDLSTKHVPVLQQTTPTTAVNQSINQSKHISIAPYVASDICFWLFHFRFNPIVRTLSVIKYGITRPGVWLSAFTRTTDRERERKLERKRRHSTGSRLIDSAKGGRQRRAASIKLDLGSIVATDQTDQADHIGPSIHSTLPRRQRGRSINRCGVGVYKFSLAIV